MIDGLCPPYSHAPWRARAVLVAVEVELAYSEGRLRLIVAKIEGVRPSGAGFCRGAAVDPAHSATRHRDAAEGRTGARPDPFRPRCRRTRRAGGRRWPSFGADLPARPGLARAGFWEITAIAEILAQPVALAARLTAAGSAGP